MKDIIKTKINSQGIAYLHMVDKENKNIFSAALIDEFIEKLDLLENDYKPKVCIIHGLKGVFSGGASREDLIDLCNGKIRVKDLLLTERLINTSFPLIAAMEGHAVGGGLMIAASCDIVIAAREMRYGAVFMNMGFTPGMGCTTLLAQMVGPYIANEMMYTGKTYLGSSLEQRGTNINYFVSQKDVMTKAGDIAMQIAEKNIKSLYLLKSSLTIKKKQLLVMAKQQEDLMHRLSFGFPETKAIINEKYNK